MSDTLKEWAAEATLESFLSQDDPAVDPVDVYTASETVTADSPDEAV